MTPLEPLYTLKVAATLIPFQSADRLRAWLYRRQDRYPPRYQRGRYGAIHRLLSHSECARIRAETVFGPEAVKRRRKPGA